MPALVLRVVIGLVSSSLKPSSAFHGIPRWLIPQRSATAALLGTVAGIPPPLTSHLSLVPLLLGQALSAGDVAVDATAGNGHDTLALARLVLSPDPSAVAPGHVVSIDVQRRALDATEARLLAEFTAEAVASSVSFLEGNHREFSALDSALAGKPMVKAFVYNLGYLPGSDKRVKTQTSDTVASLRGAADRTAAGGLVCVTSYVGHEGGAEETEGVRRELASWPHAAWRVVEHAPLNWPNRPVLFTAHRFDNRRRKTT